VEIQIRTREMHQVAEEGIAAHGSTKRAGARSTRRSEFRVAAPAHGMQRELRIPRNSWIRCGSTSFRRGVRVTPAGTSACPRGVHTPIDFAFAIHTDVGLRCVGAKINGRSCRSGASCRTATSWRSSRRRHIPSKDWLKIVKTPRARSKIRQWIKNEERTRSVSLGRDLLEKEIRRLGKSPNQLLRPEAIALALERYGFADDEELFAALGYGKVSRGRRSAGCYRRTNSRRSPRPRRAGKEGERKASVRGGRRGGSHPRDRRHPGRFSKCCSPFPETRLSIHHAGPRRLDPHGGLS